MVRAAIRLLGLAALTSGGDRPYPTMANDNVFDSQREDIELTGGDRAPYIIIRTDDDSQGLATSGDTTSRKITMRLEVGVLGGYRQTSGAMVIDWPRSDAGIEIFLDLFELQIQAALLGPTFWACKFRNMFSPSSVDSVPMFIDVNDVPVRVAAREMTFALENVLADEFPPYLKDTDPPYVPALSSTLIAVFDLINDKGLGDLKTNAARLRTLLEKQNLPVAGVYPPLTSALSTFSMSDSPAPPSGEEPVPQVTAELLES